MNFIERMKYKKTAEYQDYKKAVSNNLKDTERFIMYYKDTKDKLDELIKKGEDSNSKELRYLKNELQRWNYEYQNSLLIREFIRPNNNEEIEARNNISNTFGDELKKIVGNDSNLRFHGTPIYFAKEIIKSNTISSTADRFDGYINSSDEAGYISASRVDSISRTINYFTDFSSYMRCLPCGVLFVLNEKEGDYELRDRSEMQNVNFKSNPEQLVGILCTDEVKNMIIDWCNQADIDSSKVFSYNEFLEYAKNNNLEHNKKL